MKNAIELLVNRQIEKAGFMASFGQESGAGGVSALGKQAGFSHFWFISFANGGRVQAGSEALCPV